MTLTPYERKKSQLEAGRKAAETRRKNNEAKESIKPSPALKEHYSYIYMIHEREFKTQDKNVYKIGKTKQVIENRLNSYPKGSEVILSTQCENCDEMERKIINVFKKQYIQKTEYGNEYFEGCKCKMINTINEILLNKDDTYKDCDKVKTDRFVIINNTVVPQHDQLSRNISVFINKPSVKRTLITKCNIDYHKPIKVYLDENDNVLKYENI